MIQAVETAVGNRIVALLPLSSGITSTNAPAADGALWIGNAATAPTSASPPTSGSFLFENAGALTHISPNPVTYVVAPSGTGTINSQAGVFNKVVQFGRVSAAYTLFTAYTLPTTAGFVYSIDVILTAKVSIAGSGSNVGDTYAGAYRAVYRNSTTFGLTTPTYTQYGANPLTAYYLSDLSLYQSSLTFSPSGSNVLIQLNLNDSEVGSGATIDYMLEISYSVN
jgi:hypothetical protein